MTAGGISLGLAWGAVVFTCTWRSRPAPVAVRRRLPAGIGLRRTTPVPAAALGAVLLRLAARAVPSAKGRLARADTGRLGRAVLAGGVAVVVTPLMVVPAAVLVWSLPVLRERQERSRRVADVRRHLPEAVDLLSLAVGAGLTVPLAVAAVARRAPGPVGGALAQVVAEAGAGRRLGDALAVLPDRLGEDARPLAAALLASDRDGAPLAGTLDRLSDELRTDRRRRAEEAARRVPVKLLFPLVTCILPAFALLTVAPLLASALSALRP